MRVWRRKFLYLQGSERHGHVGLACAEPDLAGEEIVERDSGFTGGGIAGSDLARVRPAGREWGEEAAPLALGICGGVDVRLTQLCMDGLAGRSCAAEEDGPIGLNGGVGAGEACESKGMDGVGHGICPACERLREKKDCTATRVLVLWN